MRNEHVAASLRDLINGFAPTLAQDDAERWAEIDRERRQEWRDDDRESAKLEREQQEEAQWPR